MTEQPNFLTSRLRKLQAMTRKEYEESGLEKLNAPKINAAAAVYAEDQAANHSSGYQSNDSAPEESTEESARSNQNDYACAQVRENLRSMMLDDFNRPWHEEVDEYLGEEHASHRARTPTLCNGHDDIDNSSYWTQQNARNTPSENRDDVAQPSGAGQVSWPQRQSQAPQNQTHTDNWSCQAQQTQAYASSTYQLFDEPASPSTTVFHDADHNSTQNVDQLQWQPTAPLAVQAPQYTFQDRRLFDEQPTNEQQWSADDRNQEQQWAQPAQRIDPRQYEQRQLAQPAQHIDPRQYEQRQSTQPAQHIDPHQYEQRQLAQPVQHINPRQYEQRQLAQPNQLADLHEQRQNADACGQSNWAQHSDGLGRPSQMSVYLQPADTQHWMSTTTPHDDLETNLDNRDQQFISPGVVSVAAALSGINLASHNVPNEYSVQTSPMQSAGYNNTALQYPTSPSGYQNQLLKIVEPCAQTERSQTFSIANCANLETCSNFEDQLLCVESQEPGSKRYYVLVDQPPSLSEVDVSKPPPPLPSFLNKSGSVSSASNSANNTEVSYGHQTDTQQLLQSLSSMSVRPQELYHESLHQSPPSTTVSQQMAQSSHHLSDTLYPLAKLEMLDIDESNVHRRTASSPLYPQLTPQMISDTTQSDMHQRIAHSSPYLPNTFHPESTHEMFQADVLQSDGHRRFARSPSYSHGPSYVPKSPQSYAEAPQSEVNYWEAPLPSSPPHGATPDMLYSEVTSQQQPNSGSSYMKPTPFNCDTSVDEFAIQQCTSPIFETHSTPYSKQPLFNPHHETDGGEQSNVSLEATIDDFGKQRPTTAQGKRVQSAATVRTRRSMHTASPTEARAGTMTTSTTGASDSSQTTPANPATGMRRDGQRWSNSRNGNQSAQNTSANLSNGMRRDAKRGSNSRSSFESAQTTPNNSTNGGRWDAQRGSNSRNSNNSGYSTPQDRRQQPRHSGSGGRFSGGTPGGNSTKRPSYTPEDEHRLSVSLVDSYGAPLDAVLERCFTKNFPFGKSYSLRSNRYGNHGEDMFVSPLWPNEACAKLAQLKDHLNSVKERLSSYDLNEWHRHTRTTNPADLVMRRLRSDVKVEFLTQAWCKFFELVDNFKLVPQDARKSGELRTIHLCEAPGAFVASLNHYLRLNYPELKWHWRANSLNPYYEGNHLSAMINDDRFMLQTIENWDFGPDLTGDILHPGYPDHLRQVWGGGQLTHLVTADGSFDCQDKPEEQEKLVSWLHLKEALTAIRVLRKGGHFVIKMFTFFECESVCLLYLLQCVFESIHVMKPATSKEGNSEVYVVCREFKDEPSFEPFIRRLIDIDQDTYSRFAMFPLERIPRPFMRALEECATKFAEYQIAVIERNIRLYQHERYDEFRRHFEFVQEKLFEEYVQRYGVRPIPLDQTVVRMPHRRSENRFHASPKVLEQREHKQGSHDDQLKRSSLGHKDLVKVVADELASFPHRQLLSKVSSVPKVELLPQDFEIRCGKPIDTITSSQFCHGMLIRVRNELMNTMDRKKYYIAAAEMEESVNLEKNPEQFPNLCDFVKPLMLMKTYNDTQREIYGMLFDRLTTLEKNEHLTLFCFPLLTQFNISVLCILNQIFEEIVLEPPHILYLRKRDAKNFALWMPKLQEISRTYTPDQAVISFLPIRKITGSSNPFYSWVIEANNSQIIREINLFSSYHS